MKAKSQDKVFKGIMVFCTVLVVSLLLLILGYVFVQGVGLINWQFLSGEFDAKTVYVDLENIDDLKIEVQTVNYDTKNYLKIKSIESDSPVLYGITNGEVFPLKKGDIIRRIVDKNTVDMTIDEFSEINASLSGNIRLKITRPGEGIFPLIINTLSIILLSLLIALPVSLFSAIYLAEYARKGKLLNLIRFTTSALSGIPSIVFGLFGMLAFVTTLKFGFSMISGALTLSIVLLPTLISQSEEAIRRVPLTFREGSFALGATKLQTVFKVIIPNSLSGVLVGVLLSIGRIVAESAALILTAGTVAMIPKTVFESASTLTVKAYTVAKETGDMRLACAMGIVTIVLIIVVNASVGIIEKFDKMSKFS
ncbi:MAG: phosphate ABC transporter permease PstA [Eubacteriales bacterium]